MNINMTDFINSLQIMGVGMLSIFVVILLIMAIVALLTKLTSEKQEPEDDK